MRLWPREGSALGASLTKERKRTGGCQALLRTSATVDSAERYRMMFWGRERIGFCEILIG